MGGVAVKANQEMILRLTWMNEEARESAYLVTRELTAHEISTKTKTLTPPLPALPKVKLPAGELTDGKIAKVNYSFVASLHVLGHFVTFAVISLNVCVLF